VNREIRLLYFKGCPNVEEARSNLRVALSHTRLAEHWEETDLTAGDCPERWKGFPSPTVLLDAADVVSGAREQAGTRSCRASGAPTSAQIEAALGADRSWFVGLASMPAAVAGVLPALVCPACYPALAGFIGALGLGASANRVIAPLTAVLLLIALAGLAYQAKRSRNFWPLAIGVIGAAATYLGQFVLALPAVKVAGIVLLVGASFWNVLLKIKNFRRHDCPDCASGR